MPLENAGSISKCLSTWASPAIIVPKKPDPLNPQKQQLHLVLDYQSLNKSVNVAHRGNSVKSYYPLPNITYLLARLQKCTIFPSLDLRSGYHHISLTLEATLKTAFATTSGKMELECSSFWYILATWCILLSYVAGIVWIRILFCIP